MSPNPTPVPVAQVTTGTQQPQSQWHYGPISAPEASLAAAVIGAVLVVLGWIVVHWLNLKREREARAHADRNARRERITNFIAFLLGWRGDLEATHQHWIMDVAKTYNDKLTAFRVEVERVRADITDKVDFGRMTDAVGGMHGMNMDGYKDDLRKPFFQRIDVLLNFIRNELDRLANP